MIGERLSPILEEIEGTIWDHEANIGIKPNYSTEGFRAGVKIFMSVLMDKMWELQEDDGISMSIRESMSEQAGEVVRSLVKTYTGIDTKDLYKDIHS